MDNATKNTAGQPSLQLTIGPPNTTVYSDGVFNVEVELKNNTADSVLINKRLSIGYEASISREIYFKILDPTTQEPVGHPTEDYDRPPARYGEYGILPPGESVFKVFTVSHWYEIDLPKGRHELTLLGFYQADEPYFDKRPKDVINGVFQSKPVTFYWVKQ
ncbi:MAG: hypothetical protein ACPG7E_00945 [Marinirhabdus sp.]